METWKKIYKILYEDFGWKVYEFDGIALKMTWKQHPIKANFLYKAVYSPTRDIAICYGEIYTVAYSIQGHPCMNLIGKLPPLKRFDRIDFDKNLKLMYYVKNNMQLVAVDIS